MADYNFTKLVRDEVESAGVCHHSVFSESEIDWLLSDGYDDTSGTIIRITEEAIMRTTGLPVDLSMEGPARTTVVRSDKTPGQEHNTFTLVRSSARDRDFHGPVSDPDTVPKITPQDANVAVRSIDFPTARPRGTPVDGMRVDEKDNPAEGCFSAQVTVAQILNLWGVNTDELVMAINREWGIDYAGKLIRDVAFCRASDLQEFIASGGRPSPQIYMSPNVISRYAYLSKPTIDVRSVGYSASFMGRARMMCKFILASSTQFLGNDFIDVASFHMNPACMSKFDPGLLGSWDLGVASSVKPDSCKGHLASSGAFDDYIRARQATAVAAAVDRTDLATACFAVEMMERAPLDIRPGEYKTDIADRLIMGKDVTRHIRREVVRDADPRKAGAILFDYYNGDATPSKYVSVVGSCGAVSILAAISPGGVNFAAFWRALRAAGGLGDAVNTVNVASVDRNQFFKHVKDALTETKSNDALLIALLRRHLDHIRPSVVSALSVAYHLKPSKGSREDRAIKYRGAIRPWIAYRSSMVTDHKPFNHLSRMEKAATAAGKQSSMLEVDVSLIKYLSGDKGAGFHTARPLGSSIRGYWVRQYDALMKAWQVVTYIAVAAKGLSLDITRKPVHKMAGAGSGMEPFEKVACHYVGHMAYVEMLYSAAMCLAYKWCRVRVGGSLIAALAARDLATSAAFEVQAYVDYLTKNGTKEPLIDIELNRAIFSEGSLAHADLLARAKYLLTGYSGAQIASDKLLSQAMNELVNTAVAGVSRLRMTVREAVLADADRVLQHVQAEAEAATIDSHLGTVCGYSSDEATWVEDASSVAGKAGVPDNWEYLAQGESGLTENVKFEFSRYVSDLAMDKKAQSANVAALCDLLMCVADEVAEDNVELAEIMEYMCELVDETSYAANQQACDMIVLKLGRLAGFDSEVVSVTMREGLGQAIIDLASALGMKGTRGNIMK